MAAASSSPKRCLYEVLNLPRDCSPEEIRSAYKKLALQRHPDKLIKSGVSESEATASFQELVNAYEVLSDTKERAWYDSHRNQILFSSNSNSSSSGGFTSSFVPDLFPFFSSSVYSGYADKGKGFYKVYGDLFDKIYAGEFNYAKKLGLPLPKEAPLMGNLESPYVQVTAFYSYWLGFVSSMDFFWEDKYDAMAGVNRKSRRVMEDENKKIRKKAKREYNDTVRGLAEFVKKRDKRVIDMQMKRNEEMERKREEERQRKKELERLKAERAREYEEPDWAKVDEVEDEEDVEVEDAVEEKKKELYCIVCSKKFKSDKQWKNHEQSKKHKEKVAELRGSFSEEDREYDVTEENVSNGEEEKKVDTESADYLSAEEEVIELQNRFGGSVGTEQISENESEEDDAANVNNVTEEEDAANVNNGGEGEGDGVSDDDEANILEAMVSGRKLGNQAKNTSKKNQVDVSSDELEFMEYNDTKVSRRNRGGRKGRGKRNEEAPETGKTAVGESSGQAEHNDGDKDASRVEESISHPEPEESTLHPEPEESTSHPEPVESTSHPEPEPVMSKRKDDGVAEMSKKSTQKVLNKNSSKKKEAVPKSKPAAKGRRQKASADDSDHVCEKCGWQFESRNKLHKHLGDTGHASLKSR